MNLLTQNSDLKKTGIWAWTLPAHVGTLENGERFVTCPSAGACARFCYAKTGTFMFKNVKRAHQEKLELVVNHLTEWKLMMHVELQKKKYAGKFIRVHDAGDYFSKEYAMAWFDIMSEHPDKMFYSYTKQVTLFKKELFPHPDNFSVIFSLGWTQDDLVDKAVDRHADVFPTMEELVAAGYVDIGPDDKLAATSPNHRIGILRNNIPHLIKKMGDKKFSTLPISEKS